MKDPRVKRKTSEKEEVCNLNGNWDKKKFEQLKSEAPDGDSGNVTIRDCRGITLVVNIKELTWADLV